MYAELADTVGQSRSVSTTTNPLPTEGYVASRPSLCQHKVNCLATHSPPAKRKVASRPPPPHLPTEGELPCYLYSADKRISRLTTISLSTVLVGLLCCAEFRSFDRHPPFVALVNAGSRYHCCVMLITGTSSCCKHHCTSRSCAHHCTSRSCAHHCTSRSCAHHCTSRSCAPVFVPRHVAITALLRSSRSGHLMERFSLQASGAGIRIVCWSI